MGLTVKRVKAAYEKTGLKPVESTFFLFGDNDELVGACPMGTVAVAERGMNAHDIDGPETEIPELLGLSFGYCEVFSAAYDCPGWRPSEPRRGIGAVRDAERIRKHIPPTNATNE